MSDKQQNPKMDFGFYAAIPRILRTQYNDLTPAQKWLYVCLKDLCGDSGTCYRALRVLSEETGLSTGLLSKSIPLLHTKELVHAEKKRRRTGGKEVWHISIVDIWQKNGSVHPTKRSQNEQNPTIECSQNEQNRENVHNVNENTPERSQNERECSQNRDRSKTTVSKTILEVRTSIEARAEDAIAPTTTPPVIPDNKRTPSKKSTAPKEQPDLLATVSPQIQQIVQEWQGIFSKPIAITPKLLAHAETLASFKPDTGEITACRLWMYQTDKNKWYSTHGLHLGDVVREFERFRSLGMAFSQETPQVSPLQAIPETPDITTMSNQQIVDRYFSFASATIDGQQQRNALISSIKQHITDTVRYAALKQMIADGKKRRELAAV